jgi:hypothetical protein
MSRIDYLLQIDTHRLGSGKPRSGLKTCRMAWSNFTVVFSGAGRAKFFVGLVRPDDFIFYFYFLLNFMPLILDRNY